MPDNSMKFTVLVGAILAAADSVVTMSDVPADNPGLRIEQGSSGFIRFGGKATAFSFDIDANQSAGQAFKIPLNTTQFAICGGPAYFSLGTAEWVS